METLISKISTYNIFNFIFPGVIFLAISNNLLDVQIPIEDNLIKNAFVWYFTGMVISRVGSLIIEPLMLRIKFLASYDYKKYVSATIKDSKIETLLEVTNTYRTILAMFVVLFILKGYEILEAWLCLIDFRYYILSTAMLVIFLFSYRKQSNFIAKRVEAHSLP